METLIEKQVEKTYFSPSQESVDALIRKVLETIFKFNEKKEKLKSDHSFSDDNFKATLEIVGKLDMNIKNLLIRGFVYDPQFQFPAPSWIRPLSPSETKIPDVKYLESVKERTDVMFEEALAIATRDMPAYKELALKKISEFQKFLESLQKFATKNDEEAISKVLPELSSHITYSVEINLDLLCSVAQKLIDLLEIIDRVFDEGEEDLIELEDTLKEIRVHAVWFYMPRTKTPWYNPFAKKYLPKGKFSGWEMNPELIVKDLIRILKK